MLEELGKLLPGGQAPQNRVSDPSSDPPPTPESASTGNYPLQYWLGGNGAQGEMGQEPKPPHEDCLVTQFSYNCPDGG